MVLEAKRPPRMLDLFCGTGSVGRVYKEKGFLVTSVDYDKRWAPDFCVDVLFWDYKADFQPGDFHTVAIGLPCTEFSAALTTRRRNWAYAHRLARKTLEIKDYLKPQKWWLENPRNGRLPTRPYMADIPYVDVDYCQYANWEYQKPTRIWGSPNVLTFQP